MAGVVSAAKVKVHSFSEPPTLWAFTECTLWDAADLPGPFKALREKTGSLALSASKLTNPAKSSNLGYSPLLVLSSEALKLHLERAHSGKCLA